MWYRISYINGLSVHRLIEWCNLLGLLRDDAAVENMYNLYIKFHNFKRKTYLCCHVGMHCHYFPTGDRKFY